MKVYHPVVLPLFLLMAFWTKAQCDSEGTISVTICDMTTIDGDGDTVPDGMINLYDEYFKATGETIDPGTWFDPNYDFVLDPNTGDLNLWGLGNASEENDDYTYLLYKAGCTDPVLTINIVLGPFSGLALPAVGPNSVNAQVCNTGDPCIPIEGYDLYEALQITPSPHLNGTWIYEGNSPSFVEIVGSLLYVDIPYQPGVGLIEETFKLTYVVAGMAPCDVEQRTDVNISVVRRPSSGESQPVQICEQELMDGVFDADIVLSDGYLNAEDLEGTWSGSVNTGSQIASPSDNTVNIKALYNDLLAADPRFGYAIFNFNYSVKKRSGVCFDSESDIPFIIFEALRPFEQEEDLVLCLDGSEPASVDMMQELQFTTENGVLYEYLPGDAAQWEFVSGPLQPNFTPDGVVTTENLDPGTYVFRYSVSPEINCGGNCPSIPYSSNACPSNFGSTSPCPSETAEVKIVVIEPLYAGEDTLGVERCADGTAIDLISLLETSGDGIYRGINGIWTDGDGNVVPNDLTVLPINGQQTFDLTYTTTVGSSCTDQAMLNLTLYWEYSAGTGTSLEICSDAPSFNLFDLLSGTKSDNGSWTGPNGYTATYIGAFDPASGVAGEYIYTVPANGPCPASESTITVVVDERPNAGPDLNSVICRSETVLDLFALLGPDTDTDGNFVDLSSNTVVPDGILDLLGVERSSIQLEYRVDRNDECAQDVATIQLELTEVAVPVANDRNFCILEGATLREVEVQSNGEYLWYGSPTAETELAPETVLETTTYYVANVDGNGCESERVSVNIIVYNIGETNACKPDLPDGVSPNGDGQNDILDMGDLEKAFPSFELSIYNRYGTLVYKGKTGTPYFSGSANVSPSLGNDLPAGVYFYVFEPNDAVNGPFQDSFYLSK